ncbi:MAG: sugar phosphate isomerase/epimerase, partial [Verrucomicrobiales bacterium]
MQPFSRRHFLKTASASLALSGVSLQAQARPPIGRAGKPSLRPSLAAYSFRESFKEPSKLDMFGFIDYCADHGLKGAELTSYFFPELVDQAYLLRIKQHAFLRGITISGTAIGNNFALPPGDALIQQVADTKHWIDRAHIMGAPHIRVFAGAPKGIEHDAAIKQCIASLEDCCDYAGSKGIFLGLENHGGIVAEADALLEIVQAVKSPWLGVNLDTGNFRTEDPYGDLAKCAAYAVNVQVKVEIQKRGAEKGPADLPRLMAILREANYQGFVVLEYEAKEDP